MKTKANLIRGIINIILGIAAFIFAFFVMFMKLTNSHVAMSVLLWIASVCVLSLGVFNIIEVMKIRKQNTSNTNEHQDK